MADTDIVTAAVLVIGDEILSGRTLDRNTNWLGLRLNELGIQLKEARIIGDDEPEIIAAVRALSEKYDLVFTTGGIGPTHDDITAAAMAKAFGTELERNAEAERRLRAHYAEGQATPARLKMADIPVGATLIDNPVSIAPGFILGNVHVMAGIPNIMQAMMEGLAPSLKGGRTVISTSIDCHLPESVLSGQLGRLQAEMPDVSMGSYPYWDGERPGTRVVLRSVDADRIEIAAAAAERFVKDLGGDPVRE